MKCLYLAPLRYPFVHTIASGLSSQGLEIRAVDYLDFFSPRRNRFVNSLTSLPHRIRKTWEDPFVAAVNTRYLEIFSQLEPDLVFIYNNQLILPDLMKQFSAKARVAFMLGDHPLYTPTSVYNLHILFDADYVICPDSMWRDQLKRLGVHNAIFDCFGYPIDTAPFRDLTADEVQEHRSDFVYVGSASKTNWGYKRLRFLDIFKDLDLRAYISGGSFERWIDLFPDVKSKIITHDRFDADFNRMVYACSKIAPVDLVPSLFNGVHVRVFDALGAGALPLCERSVDLERVFEGIDIPLIDDYRQAADVATHWLRDEQARLECIRSMRARVEREYAPSVVVGRMVETVFG